MPDEVAGAIDSGESLDAPFDEAAPAPDSSLEAQSFDTAAPPDAPTVDASLRDSGIVVDAADAADTGKDAACPVGVQCTASLGVNGAHSCALTAGGAVWCWGDDGQGELGNGVIGTNSPVPVAVVGLSSGVVAVVAGGQHTCAITTSGGVKCWGYNASGELGDGTTTDRPTPVDVIGLPAPVVALGAGNGHTCAVTQVGALLCWGANDYGQLGNGSTTQGMTPVAVAGMSSGVVAVAAGDLHTCALSATGSVSCWGWNDYGQTGTQANGGGSHVPVSVPGVSTKVVDLVAAGDHTCALSSDVGVQCWGNEEDGELGNDAGASVPVPVPFDVSSLPPIAAITADFVGTCALTQTGSVACWGHGQFGSTPTTDTLTPVTVLGMESGIAAIAGGFYHLCALTTAGRVVCRGQNYDGQLGNGSLADSLTPIEVTGF